MNSDKNKEPGKSKNKFSGIIFVLTVCMILAAFYVYWNPVLIPKWDTTAEWEVSRVIKGFYELPEDSVSVLFLGDSYVESGISPGQMLYEYGIPAYSCATAEQTMLCSYYWLKEALRSQSPEVVVLDVDMLFKEEDFTDDSAYRKAFDYMKLSQVKIEAVKEISKYTSKKEAASFFFPMLRYHDRWKELDTKDFREAFANNPDPNFGFLMIGGVSSEAPRGTDFNTVEGETFCAKSSEAYLGKMAELCRQEGITLILIKTPFSGWTGGMHAQVMEVAASHDLIFWDYNDKADLEALGLHNPLMYSDKNHMNLFGAEKLTADISERLTEEGFLTGNKKGGTEPFFNSLRGDYYYNLETKQLPFISSEEKEKFFSVLQRNRGNYTIIVAGCAESFAFTDEATKEQLCALGFTAAFETKEKEGYVAVAEKGVLINEIYSAERIFMDGVLEDGTEFSLMVNGLNTGGYSEVTVGSTKREFMDGGINFYIYDNKNHEFVCTETIY